MGNYVFFGLPFLSGRFLDGELKRYGNATHGKRAGTAAAVIGTVSTFISATCGTVVGQNYQRTIVPLIIGFFVLSTSAFITTRLGVGVRIQKT